MLYALSQAPSSLLEALEAHLANLEGRKVGSPTTPPTGGAAGGSGAVNDPKVQQQLLAEEEQAMAKYKEQHKVRIISSDILGATETLV